MGRMIRSRLLYSLTRRPRLAKERTWPIIWKACLVCLGPRRIQWGVQSKFLVTSPVAPVHYLRIVFVAILVSSLCGMPAIAQLSPSAHTISNARAQRVAATRDDHSQSRIDQKSPARATVYSTAGTLLLTPVFGSGLVVGPSFGHFYANNTRQAVTGIGFRAAGATAFIVGLEDAVGADASEGAEAITVVGLVTVVCSAVYDIGTADDAVRRYNERHRRQVRVVPAADRNGKVGLALRVQL